DHDVPASMLIDALGVFKTFQNEVEVISVTPFSLPKSHTTLGPWKVMSPVRAVIALRITVGLLTPTSLFGLAAMSSKFKCLITRFALIPPPAQTMAPTFGFENRAWRSEAI